MDTSNHHNTESSAAAWAGLSLAERLKDTKLQILDITDTERKVLSPNPDGSLPDRTESTRVRWMYVFVFSVAMAQTDNPKTSPFKSIGLWSLYGG